MKLPKELEAKILAMSGADLVREKPHPKPKRKARSVAIDAPAFWSVGLAPACRVVTETNTHEHWTTKAKRVKAQRAAVGAAWLTSPAAGIGPECLPLTVALLHLGPRMDDDNLQAAFKAVRDEIAARIGVDDGDARVTWVYGQMKVGRGVLVHIKHGRDIQATAK